MTTATSKPAPPAADTDAHRVQTALSFGDADTGMLAIRGHAIENLAGRRSYEEVAALLWETQWPGAMNAAALGSARLDAHARFEPLHGALAGLEIIEAQRWLVGSIAQREMTPVLLVAAFGVAAATAIALKAGHAPLVPDAGLSHAADLLRLCRGSAASAAECAAMECYLVAMIDHGINTSTFAARLATSTGTSLSAAAIAAQAVLQGPLHGGAPGLVLDMLDAIGSAERAEDWIVAALDRRERLMGFGSRAYRIRDPRATLLKNALLGLPALATPEGRARLDFAEAVEAAALRAIASRKPGRVLQTNVEFYAALLLEALGLPRGGFTPLFATARAAGWAAHVREQQQTGHMLRPASRYVGPMPGAV